jgi:UDP-2-acetamido-3-amino-2,3-dideoxy-glucuronate N-acetyltransferase
MKSKSMFTNNHQTTVIEAGANVASTATLGCFVQVCSDASIENDAIVEGLVIVPSNVHIDAYARIGCGVCFVTPTTKAKPTVIGKGATIGAHAIIQAGVSIGEGAVIAPGTVVQRSIPSMAIVEGSPARIVGYVGANLDAVISGGPLNDESIKDSSVHGVRLHRMPRVVDIRGNLTVGEFDRNIPFQPKRYFIVFDVPSMETRGEHAHRECHQFLICVRGSCAVVADDGVHRQEFLLDRPDVGIHLPPMVWGIQYKYSADAVLLVYASHYYDNLDYIRNYAEFRQLVGAAE